MDHFKNQSGSDFSSSSSCWHQCTRPRSMSSPYPEFFPPMDDPADFSFKILVIGDSCVGKTSFIEMFCENVFRENNAGTVGMDLKKKIIDVDDKKIRLLVWDTAGQERYRTLTTTFYRGATGIIILYDVTRENSFNHVTNWLQDIALHVSPDICKILVGNKCDDVIKTGRVSTKRASRLAESFDFPYTEASAKTGENVDEVFENLTRQMLERYHKKMSTSRPLPRPTCIEKIDLLAKKKTFSFPCSC